MSTIQITDPILTMGRARAHKRIMLCGGEFATDNGEMPDAMARTVASWWQSSGAVGSQLATLASGLPVDRDALSDDIAATARPEGWPRELEYLATWCLNHE